MPASRARTAICSAPLEWPSRPGLPSTNFSRRPSLRERRSTSARKSSRPTVSLRGARPTPVGARYSPKLSRKAKPHSPVVTPAFAQVIEAGMMLRFSLAAARNSFSAAETARWSRALRQALSRSICSASACGETIVDGVKTTIPVHQTILQDRKFLEGSYHVQFLDKMLIGWKPQPATTLEEIAAVFLAIRRTIGPASTLGPQKSERLSQWRSGLEESQLGKQALFVEGL